MSGHRRQSKTQPTITVFAGPNGSGKTTLTNQFALEGCIDNLVNADQIAAMLASEEGLSTPTLQQQYQAAHAAEALRWEMIKNKESFTTETVMSDSARWQKFFESARQQGYRLKLIFITTRDPAINVARVAQRVQQGGHAVDTEKIVSRYQKTHKFLAQVIHLIDEGLFYDNSTTPQGPVLVLSVSEPGRVQPEVPIEELPSWALTLVS